MAAIKTETTASGAGVWWTFEDHSVRELDESALREPSHTGAAYLLFYQRRDCATPAPGPAGTAPWLEHLMQGWALSEAEKRALLRYPGSSPHAKRKAQLKSLQDSSSCVIL